MPGLARKGALQHQMVYRLRRLIAEEAARMMLQAMRLEAVGGPASVLIREPVEEFNFRWCQSLPDQLPGAASAAMCGSLDHRP
jgi:hypothetical protein